MKAVVKERPQKGATYAEIAAPAVKANEVLLKVRATSICGTDVHIYKWDGWAAREMGNALPLVIGHEFCGEIVDVGRDVKKLKKGDFVSAESHIPCGECYQCRHDEMHICRNLKIFGVDINGSYAEYVAVPEICAWKHVNSVPDEVASIMEPLGNAVFANQVAQVQGKTCVIFGAGPAGCFTANVARALDAKKIVAVDVDPLRLELAKDVGADLTLNPSKDDVKARVLEETRGVGADVVFEMSGSPAAIESAFHVLRSGGTFVAFGLPEGKITIDWYGELILKARRIVGIVGRHMFETWKLMQQLVDAGRIQPQKVVTHRFPLSKFDEAFETILARKSKCGKIVMKP